jgi:hypothetical protein
MYVISSPFSQLIHHWFTGDEYHCFPLLSFITGLLVVNAILMRSCDHSFLASPNTNCPQTSAGAGDLCICYHSDACHNSNHNHNNRLSPAPPPINPPPAPLPPHVPTSNPPHLTLPGVPVNTSAPILRSFQFQNSLPSTSEENWRRSIVRMNSANKSKRKPRAPAKPRAEPPLPEPNTTDVTILLFPVNVSPGITHAGSESNLLLLGVQ